MIGDSTTILALRAGAGGIRGNLHRDAANFYGPQIEERALQITVNQRVTVIFEQGLNAMTRRMKAWQCIGCGRIEGAQPCVGICEDRRTEFVYATDHDDVLAQLTLARSQTEVLAAVVRQLAYTTPREGEWERTYRALQARARRTLATLGSNEQPDRVQ